MADGFGPIRLRDDIEALILYYGVALGATVEGGVTVGPYQGTQKQSFSFNSAPAPHSSAPLLADRVEVAPFAPRFDPRAHTSLSSLGSNHSEAAQSEGGSGRCL